MSENKSAKLYGDKSSKLIGFGLTFDDVLIVPMRSGIAPRDASLKTQLTKKISLNIPLISAAMDTVTESGLAMAIAREGGIGIIHKNLTIEQQAQQVDKVKRSESFIISNPITLPSHLPLSTALEVMGKEGISGIPIVDNGKLTGMLTHRDVRFVSDMGSPISKFMTPLKSLVTKPMGTTMEEAWAILHEKRVEKLPVVDAKGRLKGLITAKDIQKKKSFPAACMDDQGRLRVGGAVGVTADTLDRVTGLIEAGVDVITVDTAHGHSDGVLKTVRMIKEHFNDAQVIAGNIATAEAALDLVSAGADCVKVGIGPGAICTTRVIAGIGVPQLTAIMDCAEALADKGIPLIADGGIRYSGDIAKAIAAGAGSVMIGSLFAGMEESPGETLLWEGRAFKVYYGMGSLAAMKKGSADRYSQEGAEPEKLVPEGIEGRVPFKGKLTDTVFQLMGGLRASMGYCGCADIETFQKKARFVQVSGSGVRENHPHDVMITRESPNYQSTFK